MRRVPFLLQIHPLTSVSVGVIWEAATGGRTMAEDERRTFDSEEDELLEALKGLERADALMRKNRQAWKSAPQREEAPHE